MIFIPDRTIVRRDQVVESVKREFRKAEREGSQDAAADPCMDENRTIPGQAKITPYRVVEPGSWDRVDQASLLSFPASDAPPWTLG